MADKIVSTYSIDVNQAKAELNEVFNALSKTDTAAQKAGQDMTKAFQAPLPSINSLNAQVKSLEDLLRKATDPAKIQQFNKELIVAKNNLSTFSSGTSLAKTAGQFNQLNFSVAQLTRELPSFTYSIQTGFLALSNNIPIFADNLARIRAENAALAASGQKTVPVLKQLASAFFSFNTLLSVGIVLLTVYGKEIGEFFASLFKGKEEISEAKVRLDALNSAYDSKELKSGIKSLIDMRAQINFAREGYVSKESVLKQYNETLGKSFGIVTNINDAEKAIIDNTPAYVQALVKREAANKLASDAADKYIEIERLLVKEQKEFLPDLTNTIDRASNARLGIENKTFAEIAVLREAERARQIKEIQDQLDIQLRAINSFGGEAAKVIGGDAPTSVKGAFELLREEISKLEADIKNKLTLGQPVGRSVEQLDRLKEKLEEIERTYRNLIDPADPTFTLTPKFDQEEFDKETQALLDAVGETGTSLEQQAKTFDKIFGADYFKGSREVIDQVNDYAIKTNQSYQDVYKEFLASGFRTFKEFEEAKTKEQRQQEEIRGALIKGGFSLAETFQSEYFNAQRELVQQTTDEEIQKDQELLDNKLITQEEFDRRKAVILNRAAETERQLKLSQIKVETALH